MAEAAWITFLRRSARYYAGEVAFRPIKHLALRQKWSLLLDLGSAFSRWMNEGTGAPADFQRIIQTGSGRAIETRGTVAKATEVAEVNVMGVMSLLVAMPGIARGHSTASA